MVVWTLNCVWSDEGICHGGSCSGAEKRRWRWGSDISAMRLCTVQQLSTILMSTICVWCTVVHNQGNSCKGSLWIAPILNIELDWKLRCLHSSVRSFQPDRRQSPHQCFFLHSVLQCGGVFRQEADPHPSIQPFPILAAAQRGNFKRHVHCTHCTSYWQAFNVSKGCGRRGRHKEKAGWEAIRKEGAVGEEKD